MNAIDKTKEFIIKYKFYIIGAVGLFVVLKLLLNSRNTQASSSASEYMVSQNPQSQAPADNSMAILQSQQQFQLAQQKLAFGHESELADKQLAANAQQTALEKQRIENERYVSEQNALISQQNQAANDRNTKLTLDYQQQLAQLQINAQDRTNQLNASLKTHELDVQKYIANRNYEYQTYVTNKQAQIAKKESNNAVWTGIAQGLFNLAGNAMTGGASSTAKNIGSAAYSF